MTPPPQRPEGALLKRTLDRLDLSIKAAAEVVGISDTRLRHYIAGHEPLGSGNFRVVVPQARILARIADVLSITPEELEQADRPDAAEILRDRLERAPVLAAQIPDTDTRAQVEWVHQQSWSAEEKQQALKMIIDLDRQVQRRRRAAG